MFSDDLGSLVYQMGHNTEDMVQLAQQTVRNPMKKINGEFPNIQVAIKRRDMALQVVDLLVLFALILAK